jgi:FkbM family methyltransferase
MSWRRHKFTARTSYGFSMTGVTTDYIQRHVYWHGVWEPTISWWIWQTLRPGDTFVDVGANVGYYTLLAAKRVTRSGAVIAIEPSPANVATIEAQLRLNRTPNITLHPVAAGASRSTAQLYGGLETDRGLSSLLPDWREGLELEATIPVRTLDDLLEAFDASRIALIKVDVEGFEAEVVAGASATIARCIRAAFIVETNPNTYQTVVNAFRAAGYQCYSFGPPSSGSGSQWRPTRLTTDMIRSQMDLVFARGESDVL